MRIFLRMVWIIRLVRIHMIVLFTFLFTMMVTVLIPQITQERSSGNMTPFHTIYTFILMMVRMIWLRILRMVWMIPVAFLFTMMETVIIMKIRKKSMTRSGTFFHTIYHFILITAFWFLRMVRMTWLRILRMVRMIWLRFLGMVWMIPIAFLFTMMVTMIIMKMRKNSMYDPRSCTFFHTIYHFLLITASLVVV